MRKGEMKAGGTMTRRRFVRSACAVAASLALSLSLIGCTGSPAASSSSAAGSAEEIDYADWDAVLEAAKGQTVTWYGWGGSQPRNAWIEDSLAPALK